MATEAQIKANRKNAKLAGRPPGSLSEETKLRNRALREYRKRVAEVTDSLLNAQLANALGNTFIIWIEERKTYNDKGKIISSRKVHNIIDDSQKIAELLAKYGEELISGVVDDDNKYYYMTTKKPDNAALTDILDRTYGKAKQAIVTEDETGNTLPLTTVIDSVAKIIKND